MVQELAHTREVFIETNGTIDVPVSVGVWVTCAPKPPKYEIKPRWIQEVKLVVTEELLGNIDEFTRILQKVEYDSLGCSYYYLQPCDNDLEVAKHIVEALPYFPRWRLGLQLHKLLDVR